MFKTAEEAMVPLVKVRVAGEYLLELKAMVPVPTGETKAEAVEINCLDKMPVPVVEIMEVAE